MPFLRASSGFTHGLSPAPVARELQEKIGDVPLGVDDERRNLVKRRLLKQADTQTGLPAAVIPTQTACV
jgi:hypothetical protein